VAEIEITLPTVKYGNVKVRATPEEFGFKLDEPSAFGMALAVYQASFTIGWREGAQMDVSAPQSASKEAPRTVSQVMSDEDVDTEAEAVAILKKELGATEMSEGAPPWKRPQADTNPKPWETGSQPPEAVVTAPTVLDAVW
jgi:hypothetical protein